MAVTAANGPKLSVLLLENGATQEAATILEHIGALRSLSRHNVRSFDPVGIKRSRALDFDEFDVVVIHYTVVPILEHYLSTDFVERLRRFKGLKVQMIQDDYRWVEEITTRIRYIGIDVLFTLVPERAIDQVWKPEQLPEVERITTLAGYVPMGAENVARPPLAERPLDIVYRGRTIPFWIGRLGQEKAWIAQGVLERAAEHGLQVDVDWREEARIYGDSWASFLRSGRATLGTESGASITDFDGSLERRVEAYLAERPDADFNQVHAEILGPYEGNVMMNIISPRVFEAIAAGTALVLFPGEYSGVIEPGRHYIPLERDFSNLADVAEQLRDLDRLTELTERAHEEIIASGDYSIKRFVERFDEVLDEHASQRRGRVGGKPNYEAAQRERQEALGSSEPLWRGSRFRLVRLVAKLVLALLFARRWPGLRVLIRSYAIASYKALWPVAPPRTFFKDVLRLGLMRAVLADRLKGSERWTLLVEAGDENVTFRTVEVADGIPSVMLPPDRHAIELMPNGAPTLIRWDHGSIADSVGLKLPLGRALRIVVGDAGVYDFKALAMLGPIFPEAVFDVLRLEA